VLYGDGNEARVGDVVSIDGKYRGVVVGVIDRGEYREPHKAEDWAYLGGGIVVDTDFGGLIHYPDQASVELESMSLTSRARDL
jgi:hypothetical protein